jgi:outer membrane protein OmpA-like peptidoglycan-associated protein
MNRIIKGSLGVAAVAGLALTQGCIATRDWVREQMDPLAGRVTQSETRLNQAEGQITSLGTRVSGTETKVGQLENSLSQMDGRIGQVDAKTEKALNALNNLRLERRFVVDMKEGANFAFNSANLPANARKEIDGFLSDLKGDLNSSESAVFLVTGHTDSVGSPDYNYELGRRRADAVSRYLITQKKMDPLHVVTVSYGDTAPAAENNSSQGRAKNRRVEILVYRENITSTASAANSQQNEQRSSATNPQQTEPRSATTPQQSEQRSATQQGDRLSKSY